MLKPNQFFEVKWTPSTINHYKDLGYEFTKYGDCFVVPLEHLPRRSGRKVIAICDYCGKEYEVTLNNYNNTYRESNKIGCKDCKGKAMQSTMQKKYGKKSAMQVPKFKRKAKNTNLEKYGTENPMQNPEVQQQMKDTMMERYGVEFPLRCEKFKEKSKETCYSHYGVYNAFQSDIVREKAKKTNIERYGVDNPSKSFEVIQKMKDTNIKRYGGESSQCSAEVREKTYQTLVDSNGLWISKPERETVDLLINMYGENCCTPQYLFDRIIFDCLLNINGILIDFEYDGKYWHELYPDRDIRRDNFTIKKGIKVFRVISEDAIPTKEQIQQGIEYLLNPENHIYRIYI